MTELVSAWLRLPVELRCRPQWVLAGASKAPLSVGADGKLFNASVTRPGEWLTFERAVAVAMQHKDLETIHVDKKGRKIVKKGLDIGFVLNEDDPFTCIDLDVKDALSAPDEPHLWTKFETFDFYLKIMHTFDSYTERSRSGKGLHIWVIGKTGRGFRRDGVEVYSQERFIICTGDILHAKPIAHSQALLNNMVTQMRTIPAKNELIEYDPVEDDWYVLQRAANASNSEKFLALWSGDWKGLNFPSQSEADLALMSMLAFYSESNEQCRRMFRDSGLGQRSKATKNDSYLNFTLTTIRNRQNAELRTNLDAITQAAKNQQELAAAAIRAAQSGVPGNNTPDAVIFGAVPERTIIPLHVPGSGDPAQAPTPPQALAAQMSPVTQDVIDAGEQGIPWPPGFLGTVAKYLYSNSGRQIKEISIVSAMGLMAGLTGKAWHVPQSGLNLYIILVARSAIGKEAINTGLSYLVKKCTDANPGFLKFVDFSDYASGPALIKACANNPSFVNVNGEWGRKLKQMAEDTRNTALQTLRTQMTNLYQKSGPKSFVGGIGYSATENNVASTTSVSYSLIGETTPSTFYESLTEDMMADGFLSRFLIVEYSGMRPAHNDSIVGDPDSALVDSLNQIAMHADLLISKGQSQEVLRTEAASAMIKKLEEEADREINSTDDESRRQMWNRAALKAIRLAAIAAVCDNWISPVITETHFRWAEIVIRKDIAIMKQRLDSGDVGTTDIARERKLVAILKDYIVNDLPVTYKALTTMKENQIVPRHYLQTRCARSAAFYNYRYGQTKALEESITNLLLNGALMEVKKESLSEQYKFQGKAYRVLHLPNYDAESRK